MSLKLYIHEGSGHWIGSVVVLFALSDEEAQQAVRKYLDDHGLPNEKLNIRLGNDYEPGIVYSADGDY